MTGARVQPPPAVPRSAGRGVAAVLRRRPDATCLERALVLQSWEAAHGHASAVIIGVQGPSESFRAHAWLEDAPDGLASEYTEILRLPAAHAR